MSETMARKQDVEELVQRYVERPRADLKDLIIVVCAPMVERIARRFSGIEPQEDLVQVGFIGLLNALTKFDPKAGVKFNTYATHLIAGEIKHYLRDRAQTIRQPAWLQELRARVTKTGSQLQARLGRMPTEGEIAYEIGVSESAVREVFTTGELLRVGSLDSASGEDDGGEADQIDGAGFCPEQLSVEDRVVLETAMSQLREIEQRVLVLFHFDAMNQTEIAHNLGISCNYVSHILRQSLSKLRRILTNEDEKDRILRRQSATLDDSVLDPHTGHYSEEYFKSRLSEEMHRVASEGGALSVILVDFTGLESLLSFYGEASVRDLLLDVGEMLKDSLRRLDVVCRHGPAGFGIILPGTGPTVAVIQQRLAQRFEQWLSVRRSPAGGIRHALGRATFPEEGRTVAELLAAARPNPPEAVVEADPRTDRAA
jgi:RNA polymerase sigma-B factor